MHLRWPHPLLLALVVSHLLGVVRGAEPRVKIEGGADATGHNYEWTVINNGGSAVVQVELTHCRATLFFGPNQWKVECDHLLNVGVSSPTGLCKASAPPDMGLMPGRRGTFRMQCATTGTTRGKGTMRVVFANGSEEIMTDVELPVPEAAGDRYIPLFGLGLIAALYAVFHWARRRNGASAAG